MRVKRKVFPGGTSRLLVAVLTILIIWLGLLPWLADRSAMRSHLDWLEEKKIDPSAMYYTELEVMDEILRRQ